MITISDLMYSCKLRRLRELGNMKQLAAAQLCGLECQQLYSNLENGKANFSDEIIRNICAGFKITVPEFTRVDKKIISELILESDLGDFIQTDMDGANRKHMKLYILECEKRLSEYQLECAQKDKLIIELQGHKQQSSTHAPIFVLA